MQVFECGLSVRRTFVFNLYDKFISHTFIEKLQIIEQPRIKPIELYDAFGNIIAILLSGIIASSLFFFFEIISNSKKIQSFKI